MCITIFLNNGKQAEVDCADLHESDMQTLARQISTCGLVHTAWAQSSASDKGLRYSNGLTEEGA